MKSFKNIIEEACPNGVPYVTIGEIAISERQRNKKGISKLAYSITQRGLIPTADFFGEKTKITSSDTSNYFLVYKGWFVYSPSRIDVGSISYLKDEGPVIVSPLDVVFSIDESKVLPDYLLSFLLSYPGMSQILFYRQGIEGTGRRTLPFSQLAKIEIPLPPLPIQQEIVRILDTFTEAQANLEQELELRKKQYEYYRNQLLTFDENVEKKTLDQISINCDRRRKPITSSKRVAGIYPYYGASGIVDFVEGYIFDGDYLLISEDGANLLARSTPIAFSISGKTWVNNHAHVIEFENRETRRLVETYLNSIDLTPWITGGAQPKLNQEKLNTIPIPIPSLQRQQEIVSILDKFESAIQTLEEELALRKKQYEYYREKLLTFN
ncbi:MAG: restriction endonuclease subunit S [Bacteroidaceae bacterium]|nr:restriction endonuclease subunit S [Bacteroidaceae bacterium]